MKKFSLKISTATVFVATDGSQHNNKKDAETHSVHLHLHEALSSEGAGVSLLHNFAAVSNAVDAIRGAASELKQTPDNVVGMLIARYGNACPKATETSDVTATAEAPIDPATLRNARKLVNESVGKKGKKSNALIEALALVARADAAKQAAKQAGKVAKAAGATTQAAAPAQKRAPRAKPAAPVNTGNTEMSLEQATAIYEASKSKRGKKSEEFNNAKAIVLAAQASTPPPAEKNTAKPDAVKPPAPGALPTTAPAPAAPTVPGLPPFPLGNGTPLG
jgi:hypothetical protein